MITTKEQRIRKSDNFSLFLSSENYEGWGWSPGKIDRSWRNMAIHKWKWMVLGPLGCMNNADFEKKIVNDNRVVNKWDLRHRHRHHVAGSDDVIGTGSGSRDRKWWLHWYRKWLRHKEVLRSCDRKWDSFLTGSRRSLNRKWDVWPEIRVWCRLWRNRGMWFWVWHNRGCFFGCDVMI